MQLHHRYRIVVQQLGKIKIVFSHLFGILHAWIFVLFVCKQSLAIFICLIMSFILK